MTKTASNKSTVAAAMEEAGRSDGSGVPGNPSSNLRKLGSPAGSKKLKRLNLIKFLHYCRRGLTPREISKALNIHKHTVHDWAKRYGVKPGDGRRRQPVPFGMTEDEVETEFRAEVDE